MYSMTGSPSMPTLKILGTQILRDPDPFKKIDGCVWKCCVPLKPMVLLIIIPMKNGYFIGNIPNIFRQTQISIDSFLNRSDIMPCQIHDIRPFGTTGLHGATVCFRWSASWSRSDLSSGFVTDWTGKVTVCIWLYNGYIMVIYWLMMVYDG